MPSSIRVPLLLAVTPLLLHGLATDLGAQASPEPDAPTAAEEEVLATVHALFDAMRARDTVALAALFHPDARLQTAAPGDGGITVRSTPVADFVTAIGGSEAYIDERLGREEVRVDGGLASAWTPYALFVDGEFSHCGVNAFQLVRASGGWKILQVTDTRRPVRCPPGAPR